ncbi:uncharacterized protein LOC112510367 isoform X2 [Cynara cardunculus var. scolymus]|uniref:uncharacterized protein LOC112510367 isoform X2 n=1 Tax=Cynara cardunculus var. scolymus TaxID=59895 RepID=UPI000D62A240|nr:uncharacterized protein LOC112510367 isoform X2 [Cynara cardunculus var. scolymus]
MSRFRPKVEKEEAHGSDDVQRMYIILSPHDSIQHQEATTQEVKHDPLLRLIVMGRKRLPDPTQKGTPFWGFVELVTTKIQDVKNALKGEEYDTKTRGHRHKPPARALGEGVYRILKHHIRPEDKKKMHTHLIYKLQFPAEDDDQNQPQEALNVEREASFLIQIKNPIINRDVKRKQATFPAHLQAQFGKLRFHAADPPEFLNYEGCEFLLISASDDIQQELGLELKLPNELDDSCSHLLNTFGELASTDALFRGIWV